MLFRIFFLKIAPFWSLLFLKYFSHNTHNKEAIPSKDIPNKVVTPNKDILLNKVVILLNKEVINIHLSNNNTLLNKEANILLSNRVAIISKNIKNLLFFFDMISLISMK